MIETIDDLRILAKQVRNASSQGENTAERVGHVMEGTLDLIEGASPDLSKYYTKQESDTLLLPKWTYDAARAASWDAASKDKHTHTNKPALDLIVYDPVKNVWKFTGNAAFSGDVISYANLGDVDIPTIYEGLPIDNRTIKRDINGVLFAESTTGGSFDESSMWTALGTSISSKLIAQRYLNLSGYATETYVTEKIQGLGAVFNLKGTKATPSDLPTTGNKVGDVWYVASESVGYIWITDEKGVLRWEKFGEPVDLSEYYTKTETNALLSNKWTTDTVLISHWNDAYTLRHSHSNKDIIDGITNTLINNWNSASADAHKHANKSALDLIEYDSVKKLWKFTGNAAFSGDVISYANLGDLNIPGIYEGLPIDNVTIKRNSAGALYSLSGSGGDFDKAAMWLALASSTTEQINKSHLTTALADYLPLSGGPMRGPIRMPDNTAIQNSVGVGMLFYDGANVVIGSPGLITNVIGVANSLTVNGQVVWNAGNFNPSSYVLGTDPRLSDSRNAKDVYAWAKAATKPIYSYSEITGTPPAVDLSNYVTLNGDQTISGVKTITYGEGLRYLGNDNIISIGHNSTADRIDVVDRTNNVYASIRAGEFQKNGGLSSQFLKADGSIDSNAYVTINHNHTYLLTEDYRNRNPLNFFNKTFTPFFLAGSKLGLSGYCDAMYLNSSGDASGGKTNLLALSKVSGEMYRMAVNQGAATWDGTLVKMLDSSNWTSVVDGRYLPLTGGALTGNAYVNGNVIWHAGNDGLGSGLDADMLDGLHKDSFLQNTSVNPMGTTVDNIPTSLYTGLNRGHIPTVEYNAVLHLTDFIGSWGQLRFTPSVGYSNRIRYRCMNNTTWKVIAYLDDNVASATKLQTSRYIWGQRFDGTGDVIGAMSGVRSINGISATNIDYISSQGQYFYTSGFNSTPTVSMINANVGISTAEPVYKLDVRGTFRATGDADFGSNLNVSGKILSANASFDSFRTKGGIVAEGNTLQLGNIKLVVNPSAKTIRFEMLDGTPCNIVSTGDMIIYN